jgi:hypothetical protein
MLKISHNIWWIPPIVFYDFLEGYPPSPLREQGPGDGGERSAEGLESRLRKSDFNRGKTRCINSY